MSACASSSRMRLPDIDATAPWNSCDIARYAASSPRSSSWARAPRSASCCLASGLAVRGTLDVEVEGEHASEHGRVHRLHDRPAAGSGFERDETVELEHTEGL